MVSFHSLPLLSLHQPWTTIGGLLCSLGCSLVTAQEDGKDQDDVVRTLGRSTLASHSKRSHSQVVDASADFGSLFVDAQRQMMRNDTVEEEVTICHNEATDTFA